MILLGEDPGRGLIPGGLVIIFAIAVGQYGRIRTQRAERRAEEEAARREAAKGALATDEALAHESRINFKGA